MEIMCCRLDEIIKERGIKITWLSKRSGIPRQTIHSYIKGTIPTLDRAYAIADVLGLAVYDIWYIRKTP